VSRESIGPTLKAVRKHSLKFRNHIFSTLEVVAMLIDRPSSIGDKIIRIS
jgi:hypothetical protein